MVFGWACLTTVLRCGFESKRCELLGVKSSYLQFAQKIIFHPDLSLVAHLWLLQMSGSVSVTLPCTRQMAPQMLKMSCKINYTGSFNFRLWHSLNGPSTCSGWNSDSAILLSSFHRLNCVFWKAKACLQASGMWMPSLDWEWTSWKGLAEGAFLPSAGTRQWKPRT